MQLHISKPSHLANSSSFFASSSSSGDIWNISVSRDRQPLFGCAQNLAFETMENLDWDWQSLTYPSGSSPQCRKGRRRVRRAIYVFQEMPETCRCLADSIALGPFGPGISMTVSCERRDLATTAGFLTSHRMASASRSRSTRRMSISSSACTRRVEMPRVRASSKAYWTSAFDSSFS